MFRAPCLEGPGFNPYHYEKIKLWLYPERKKWSFFSGSFGISGWCFSRHCGGSASSRSGFENSIRKGFTRTLSFMWGKLRARGSRGTCLAWSYCKSLGKPFTSLDFRSLCSLQMGLVCAAWSFLLVLGSLADKGLGLESRPPYPHRGCPITGSECSFLSEFCLNPLVETCFLTSLVCSFYCVASPPPPAAYPLLIMVPCSA